ncbi:MAG: ribonuclease J [Turicibacter sp.]|nr:ribonuclease J [Turicibacter sp.]
MDNKRNNGTFNRRNTASIKPDEVAVFALGGLGEIGKNTYCIEYKNEIIIIDAGIKFPDDQLLGVDYVIPDYQYLVRNQEKIAGLFITHGHEDHIGGISFLLRKVKIPVIHAPRLSIELMRNKLEERKLIALANFREYQPDTIVKTKHMEIEFFRVNHSIPDSFGLSIKTDIGRIVHTGDFKFDLTPVGPTPDYYKMAKYGEEGVLCLLSDSTSAELPVFSVSERVVGDRLLDVFKQTEGRAIVATFASNVHRVQQIIEACVATGRKIAVFGRSMESAMKIALEYSYLTVPEDTFISGNDLNRYPSNEVAILCTGSQGEPMAALSRIAAGIHKDIQIIPGDTVIFSSSPIPGNAIGVGKTINNLQRAGAEVIVHSLLNNIHASGHGGQEELKLMLNLIKPKYFMPMHGEYRMLSIHKKLAIQCGVEEDNCFVMNNGDVLSFNGKGNARLAGRVPAATIYTDENGVSGMGGEILRTRRILSEDGLLIVVATIRTKDKRLMNGPNIVSRGFVYMKESEELIRETERLIRADVIQTLHSANQLDIEGIKQAIEDAASPYLFEQTKRRPMILPIIMEV